MVKFTSFDAPTGVAGPVRAPQLTADHFGGSGQGLQSLGRGVEKYGQNLKQLFEERQERSAGLFREETVANDRLKWAARLTELQNSLPHGGMGAAEILRQEMEDHHLATRDTMTTELAKRQYDVQHARLRASTLSTALAVEATAAGRQERATLVNSVDAITNAARANPMEAAAGIEQIQGLVAGLKNRKGAEKFGAEAIEGVWAAAADGLLSVERLTTSDQAKDLLAQFKSKEAGWQEKLDPVAYARAVSKAQTRIKQLVHQEETEAVAALNAKIQEVENGKSGLVITEDDIAGITSPDVLKKVRERARLANRVGAMKRVVRSASRDELRAMSAALVTAEAAEGDHAFEVKQRVFLDAALAVAKQEANKADERLIERLKPTFIEVNRGVTGAVVTDEDIAEAQNPKTRDALIAWRTQAIEVANLRKVARTAPLGGLSVVAEVLKENQLEIPGDWANDDEKRSIFHAEIQKRNAAIKRDRAAYAEEVDPGAAKAARDFAEDPSVITLEALVAAQTAAQTRLGLDPRDVYILSKGVIDTLKSQKRGLATEADVPEAVAEFMANQEELYGRHWPQVQKQFIQEGLFTGTEMVAANMARPDQAGARMDLLRAANTPNKDWTTNLGPTVMKEIKDVSLKSLAPLMKTIALSGGGVQVGADHLRAVQQIAQQRVLEGKSVDDAVKSAAADVVLNTYHFSNTYRVPNTAGVDGNTIDHTLRRVMPTINFDKLEIPESRGVTPEDRRDAYKKRIEQAGFWVTNRDETGIILVDEHGTPVRTLGKAFLEITWDELKPQGANALVGVSSARIRAGLPKSFATPGFEIQEVRGKFE